MRSRSHTHPSILHRLRTNSPVRSRTDDNPSVNCLRNSVVAGLRYDGSFAVVASCIISPSTQMDDNPASRWSVLRHAPMYPETGSQDGVTTTLRGELSSGSTTRHPICLALNPALQTESSSYASKLLTM